MSIPQTLPERIRMIRGEMGQAEFAAKIGSSQSGISAYEKGQRKPDYTILVRVCQEFAINLEWLLVGTGPMHKDEAPSDGVSPVLHLQEMQHSENIEEKKRKTRDVSPVVESQREIMDLFKKNMELQERLMAVMQENADLRVQAERDATRIRELERALEDARRECRTAEGAVGEKSWL